MLVMATIDRMGQPPIEFKKGYSAYTRITSKLVAHVDTLLYLFSTESPLMVPLRPSEAHMLHYVVGDTSATIGFQPDQK